MTSPPLETSPRLDDLERRTLQLAENLPQEVEPWRSLFDDIDRLPIPGPPPLDPEAARKSGQELRLLALALQSSSSSAPITRVPAAHSRAGYTLEGERGSQEVQVAPAFARALVAPPPGHDLQREFSDLWAVDLGLWRKLTVTPLEPSTLALSWLSSPGRRLVQDLSVVASLPEAPPAGAADFSSERVRCATGCLPPEQPRPLEGAWFELHTALPGPLLDRWRPATEDVNTVLRILEGRRGDPVFLRGAALAWLLDRAATTPFYELEGLQRDLREDLPLALINGFPDASDEPRHGMLRAAARLEMVCLLHAARLGSPAQPRSIVADWHLARWLQSCTFRSPFFGGDEESLAARLRALLPPAHTGPVSPQDVLDPKSFEESGEGLDVGELALVSGAARHYWPGARHPTLLPTPLPLVHALRRIASRTCTAGERQAEALLQRWQVQTSSSTQDMKPHDTVENGLGWSAHHVAPCLVARWLMTHQRISWLEQASPAAQRECLDLFEEDPSRYEWVAFAFYAEGSRIDSDLLREVPALWRRVVEATQGHLGSQGALALMAVGILDQLPDEDARWVAALAREAETSWRHRALEALAEAAEKRSQSGPWLAAMDGLLTMCQDETLESQERIRAALLALRRATTASWPERTRYLEHLASLVHRSPLDQSVPLRRELRRLGLLTLPDSKGAR